MRSHRKKKPETSIFTIVSGEGTKMVMEARMPYGEFISGAAHTRNITDLEQLIGSQGLSLKSVRPLITYLNLSNEKLGALLGISTRTLSRWDDNTAIGVMASKTLLEIDKLTKKGIDIFGSREHFTGWLQQPNISLGGITPIEQLTKPYGVELIEDTLEAMEYGSVM